MGVEVYAMVFSHLCGDNLYDSQDANQNAKTIGEAVTLAYEHHEW